MARKRIDLTGQRFGRLIVISYNEEVSKQKKGAHWNCKCDCGNEVVISGINLRRGSTTSCGCYQKEKATKDLTDQKFGRLTVIKRYEKGKYGKALWLCKCDCGNEVVVRGSGLIGGTISCGCYRREKTSEIMKEMTGENNPSWKGGITPISTYLRDLLVVRQWRKDTYVRENSKCQLTGKHVHGGNSAVHHLYGFNMIVLEAHELHNIQIKSQVKDYTEKELHKLEEYVTSWHKDGSNAVLLSEDVHSLFHSLYKYGNNTPEQFEEFRERYIAGEFKDLI